MNHIDWKMILALAVLVTYCEIDAQKLRTSEKIACIEKSGTWKSSYGGLCVFEVK